MADLKVGLIGCGRIAQIVHLNLLTRLPGVALVALAESDAQRRAEAERRAPSAVAVADYHDLLARPEVEAVVICLPPALHAEAAIAALQHGKHVYLEKPLATTLTDGQAVLEAWAAAGTVGMIGFNYRFNPLYEAARRHVRAGRLGALVGARSSCMAAVRPLPSWKTARSSGGGALLDQGSHHVDLVAALFDQPIREVWAGVRSQRSEEDSATLQLRLADGLLVQSFFSISAVEEDRFEIYGQAGKLTVDRHGSAEVTISGPTAASTRLDQLRQGLRLVARGPRAVRRLLTATEEPSYRAALLRFAAAARAGQSASPDLRDGYRGLAVIDAAERSAASGRLVTVTGAPGEDPAP
jgi:myo-inositol 2-dehydrogenase / D-chiro-inositol 1-dehydrogenase